MLSGFSPSLFKAVVDGEMVEEEEVVDTKTGEKVVRKKVVTPYETVRRLLDDERYFSVREVLNVSKEGALAGYFFVRPVSDTAEDGDRPPAKKPRTGVSLATVTARKRSTPAGHGRKARR
jgi:hypothetical protein